MDIHLYLPAVIVMVAAPVAFLAAVFLMLFNFTDASPSWNQSAGMALGVLLVYAAPVGLLIGLGMQISHWV